jgi:glycosyltransferase involved in cell wall biosynthesis
MPRVSVCIPSYNAAPYIGETIRSVLEGTYADVEVVVNDDASTDGTPQVVEAFDNDRVRLYCNPANLGVPENWNRALSRASGSLVGLLNHDDLYGPFWLTFAVHVLDKYPHIGWVATAFRIVDEQGDVVSARTCFPDTGEVSRRDAFQRMVRLDGLGPYLARREILEEVGYYDVDAGPSADNDLFLRLASRYHLYYSANPHHAAWRRHHDNLSRRWSVVDQCAEGLRMLNKAFSDPALPRELRDHEASAYTYFYHKALQRALGLLEKGDLETVQRIIALLHSRGYGASGALDHSGSP